MVGMTLVTFVNKVILAIQIECKKLHTMRYKYNCGDLRWGKVGVGID